ncbi:MAG: hypothetical protein SFZ03_03780, partial [Candidatus Melainabacteria bacterium]|nr:hypothetical protein [Candidatus Melainabacteria bacterium]
MKIQTVNQQPLQQRLQTLWVGYFGKTRATGSVIVLVLALLFLITFEMLIMGLVVSRSLGEEGILVSQNLGAREATQVAMTRLVDRLNSYLLTNTAGSAADVAFASGGAQAINNQVLQTRNPEAAGSAEQNTDITISAWVSARRGNYFEISARAVTGGVSLTRKRWVLLNPCNASGTLQTIVSARNHPGAEGAIAVDPISGRVFFGDGNGGSGNFYTWDPATGLSTLVSGRSGLGHQALGIDTSTGRVYFGEAGTGGTRFYTWHSSTGLSVLFTGVKPGLNSVAVDSVNGRVFFGAVNSGDDNFLTWSAATGVSVLLDSIGASAEGCTVTSASSGRVFFCDADILYTWHSSTGLSTVKVGDPLGSDLAMYGTLKIDATDRVYFGETDIGGNHAISRLFTWHSSTGLSTILGGRPDLAGNGNIQIDPTTNRVFFGEYDDDSNPINYYTWHPSTGLSTLVSARPWIGHGSSAISHLDGRVFFGQRATGNFYTWHSTTGLSTLVSNVSN